MHNRQLLASGIVAAIILLSTALAPIALRTTVHQGLENAVRLINAQGDWRARLTDVAPGWFSGHATLILQPRNPELSASLARLMGAPAIRLALDIAYGPLPFAAWRRQDLQLKPVAALIDGRIPGLSKLLRPTDSRYQFFVVIHFDGSASINVHLSPGRLKLAKDGRLAWQAAIARLRIPAGAAGWSSDAHVGRLHLDMTTRQGQTAVVAVSPINWQSKHEIVRGRLKSYGALDTGEIVLTMDSRRIALLNGSRISGMVQSEGADYLAGDFSFALGLSAIGQNAVGPISLDVELAHLYRPALVEFGHRGWFMALHPERLTDPASLANEALYGFARLLRHQPQLKHAQFRFAADGSGLELSGHAHVAAAPTTKNPDIGALLDLIHANMRLRIARPLLIRLLNERGGARDASRSPVERRAQSQRRIIAYEEQGLITPQGDGYDTDIRFEAGQIRLNGSPFDLAMP
ncbi:DUF945 family protein [Acidihalobacter prosperus]|nr:DUF945 family protein [Acidihalobacter prosperus]